MADKKRLVVIDGKSVFYRGYYAMPNLSTNDGTPTGGVYGFAVMALEVIKRLKPDYVCVAWDKPKTNIRRRLKLYPDYKAGRKAAPPDFYAQIPMLHELLDAFGWPLYELDDYEADDIMGCLAVQAKAQGLETLLVTSDMDMLQLVNGDVHVYALKTGLSNIELYNPKSFEAKYGIGVEQFLDLKALKGDSSDNIPGVPGIGEKGAIELLKAYKTLDNIYDNLALIKDSLRKKLEAGKELAYLSKELADIWTDAPLKLDLKATDLANCQPEQVLAVLNKLEFKSLARQLPEVMKVDPSVVPASLPTAAKELPVGKVTVVTKDTDLTSVIMGEGKEVVLHTRAGGKHGRNPHLIIISPSEDHTYVLDMTKLKVDQVVELLAGVKSLVGYDLKSSLKVLIELGAALPPVAHDVQIGAFLVNSLRRDLSLSELASSDLGYGGSLFEDLDDDELISRAGEITAVLRGLANLQGEQMSELTGLIKVAEDIEWPVIPVLARMEHQGIYLDTEYLSGMAERVADKISDLEQEIYGHADQEFNISSPAQLADILFVKLNLPHDGVKKGKTGYSTAAAELDKLRGLHPIIDLITSYREVTKLKNTYIDPLPKMVDEASRLHTTYAMTVAQTGRLSSNDPNLQNIPVRTELGREIRTAFVAAPEHTLVSADYSQFELRLAAYLCGDEELMDQFNRDIDVHLATAAQVYDRSPEDVTKNMRRDAKAVNFGIMYGQGPHGLVQTTGMTYEAAKQFIAKYFEIRPKLKAYIDSVKDMAKNKGYVETMYGRRRPTPDVHSSNFIVREAAYRAAVNMPFQGSAADIMKLGMIAVQKRLDEEFDGEDPPQILLQIHDSLIVECIASQAEKVAKLIKETMENVVSLPIKLTVDTSTGENWGKL
ncbi:MAG: DNA polymerase I [Candidatus Saccharibacteria bacterium]|nr:DNA polymerase I [Candidatus Saccharibacteria bacterium]